MRKIKKPAEAKKLSLTIEPVRPLRQLDDKQLENVAGGSEHRNANHP